MGKRVRASVVCVHDGKLLCVSMRDPKTRVARLFPPGGMVEPGETPVQAAVREALEETGYRVIADEERVVVVDYDYTWDGVTHAITTHFVRAELAEPRAAPAEVRDAAYNEGVVWVPLAEVRDALAFHEAIRGGVLAVMGKRAAGTQ